MAMRRIGQILVDLGYIDDHQLEMLLEEQAQQPGSLLGKIAEDMGLVNDDQMAQALAEQFKSLDERAHTASKRRIRRSLIRSVRYNIPLDLLDAIWMGLRGARPK